MRIGGISSIFTSLHDHELSLFNICRTQWELGWGVLPVAALVATLLLPDRNRGEARHMDGLAGYKDSGVAAGRIIFEMAQARGYTG